MSETSKILIDLLRSRQTVLPKRLMWPGPDPAELQIILDAASHAPDHGEILPWRFILIPTESRAALSEAFSKSLIERDPLATMEQLEQAREKAIRAPLLLLLTVDKSRGDAEVDLLERVVSAGCAVQNMLLAATALGFGSALTSGKALKTKCIREFFQLTQDEYAICFLSFGCAEKAKQPRIRPKSDAYTTTWRIG